MHWYLKAFRQYADFSGRARRKEYWMFVLFFLIFYAAGGILDALAGTVQATGVPVIALLVVLGHFVPALAVAWRRLHDTDRSGGWYFISLVPLVGSIILLVFLATEGNRWANRFGPDPKLAELGPQAYGVPPQPNVA